VEFRIKRAAAYTGTHAVRDGKKSFVIWEYPFIN